MSSVALARVYQQSFESHPHYTLAVTNGTLNALGDVVAQSVQILVRLAPARCLLLEFNLPIVLDTPTRKRIPPVHIRSRKNGALLHIWSWDGCALVILYNADIGSHLTIPGPLIGRWNTFLERRFPLRVGRPSKLTDNSRVSIAGLTKRVSSDQFLM
jgi:protein Mpv17